MNDGISILSYAAEELAEAKQLQAQEDAARAKVRELDRKISEVELAYYKRKNELRKPDRSRVLAEAAAAGLPPPPEPPDPPGPPLADLEATKRGLEAMRDEAEDAASRAHGNVRATIVQAFEEGAQRAAVDYLERARDLSALHAAIGAAQTMLGQVGRQNTGLVGPEWDALTIPNSGGLRALANVGKVKGSIQRLPIAGGGEEFTRRRTADAYEAARSEIRDLLGGRWPFER